MAGKIIYKKYHQNQLMLLPPSLDELVAYKHRVRLVNTIIDQIDISKLEREYKGGGTSSYHPRMLLKVMIYSYLCNVYSSRAMEQQLRENIHFMWLSGMSQPDHNTINRFRSERLKNSLETIFTHVITLMVDQGVVNLK
jgi:transposase